jgi:DNA-binding beta-propeller fold protein YncE
MRKLIVMFAALGATLLSVLSMAAEPGAYRLDETWPNYPADMQFEMGSGVAVDKNGIVYLYTRDIEHWGGHPLAMKDRMGRGTVSMFDADGNYLGKWGPSTERGFALGPHTMYIDAQGMFWFVDRDGHTVKKYDPDGTLLLTLGELGQWGDGPDRFNGPTAVVVQANGNLVVADGYWNSRLVFFSGDGKFLKSVGEWGRGPGQFNSVHALAQDAQGRLLAVDFCGGTLHPYVTAPGQIAEERTHRAADCVSRIQILDGNGAYLSEWTHVSPLSVAVYGDRVYASDKMRNLAVLDAKTGAEIERIDEIAIYIHQMAISPSGDVYVASVYPEHAGFPRGIHGPTHRRWALQVAPASR